jgi:glutathione S-transferase
MLILWQFPPCFGLPSASPFCMKLEGFLRLADIPYRTAPLTDLRDAPKGKGPFIEEDGVRIGDSALIIDHLERKHGIDLDRELSPTARAVAHAFGVMLEERTYFALVFNRWMEEQNWPVVRDAFFADLPPDTQDAIREHVRGRLLGHGIGVHKPEEVYRMACRDIDALALWLDDKPFFMGDAPSRIDATLTAFVAELTAGPFVSPLADATRGHASLIAYRDRLMARLFPAYAT